MVVRTACCLFTLALLCAPAAHAGTARFDSGGKGGRFGATYVADRLYTVANGAGALGGTAATPPLIVNGQVIENTAYPALLNSVRDGVDEYRFDVPNGSYLLTLQFVELQMNGPNLRRFSVLAEGLPLLPDLDLYARHGRNYAVTYRFAVTVADGQLNVVFPASIGQSTIAGIAVEAFSPPARAPRTPASVTALGGYARNIIAWPDQSEPGLAGYLVSRADTAAGPYTPITPLPVPDSRYFDDAVTPFASRHYRVAAVDVFGKRSGWSAAVAAAPLDDTQTSLPAYRLTIPPDQYAILQADTDADYVSADFAAGGIVYPDIGVRFRGATSRDNQKKSWKINFKKSAPFEGDDKLNLKSVSLDPGLLSECLAAGLLAQAATLSADCSFAHLSVNGEYLGVHSRIEEIDPSYFQARGIDPQGQLLEAEGPVYANFSLLDDYATAWNDQSENDDGYPALAALIQTINTTPDRDFPGTIAAVLHVDAYLEYWAWIQLFGDWDHVTHNFHIYRSPGSPLWELIPKDFDQGFGQVTLPLLYGTQTTPDQPVATYNVLTSRLLAVPLFRQWYANKLGELLATQFTPERLAARIDGLHQAIAADARRDVYKRHREDNTAFDASPTTLQDFVVQRRAFVQAHLPALSPGVALPLMINEVLADNRSGIVNGAGLRSPWLELYNPGPQPYDLSGHHLSNDPSQPTRWTFPAGTTVPAGGHRLVWLDNQPVPGELHASFTLDPRGQSIALYAPAPGGPKMLDLMAYRALPPDVAYGRRVSGSALWVRQGVPTPGAANLGPQRVAARR